MASFFGVLALVLSFGVTIPYAADLVKGRAKLARSTRVLFLLLMLVVLVVQSREFTGWVLFLTVGEVLSQALLFILAIRYGVGGLSRSDIICYIAFAMSLSAYLMTKDAALALTLLIVTDAIAFTPTVVKIWRDPSSDTWMYFVVGGVGAAGAALLARDTNTYMEIAFPVYILVADTVAAAPLLMHYRRSRKSGRHDTVVPF